MANAPIKKAVGKSTPTASEHTTTRVYRATGALSLRKTTTTPPSARTRNLATATVLFIQNAPPFFIMQAAFYHTGYRCQVFTNRDTIPRALNRLALKEVKCPTRVEPLHWSPGYWRWLRWRAKRRSRRRQCQPSRRLPLLCPHRRRQVRPFPPSRRLRPAHGFPRRPNRLRPRPRQAHSARLRRSLPSPAARLPGLNSPRKTSSIRFRPSGKRMARSNCPSRSDRGAALRLTA